MGPGNVSHMSSSKVTAPPEVAAAFAALDAAVEVVRSLDWRLAITMVSKHGEQKARAMLEKGITDAGQASE